MKHRNTVVGILQRDDGKILIGKCLRNNAGDSNTESNTWKFPQGGIELNEDHFEALKRELDEELNYKIGSDFKKLPSVIQYYFFDQNGFPNFEVRLNAFLIKEDFPEFFNFDKKEFSDLKWIDPSIVIDLELGIRKTAYLVILREFNLV